MAFGRFEFQSVLLQTIRDGGQPITMLFKGLQKDQDVVQIDETYVIRQPGHYKLHRTGKLTRCIAKPKAKHLETPLTFTRDERNFVAISLVNNRLPIPLTKVTKAEIPKSI